MWPRAVDIDEMEDDCRDFAECRVKKSDEEFLRLVTEILKLEGGDLEALKIPQCNFYEQFVGLYRRSVALRSEQTVTQVCMKQWEKRISATDAALKQLEQETTGQDKSTEKEGALLRRKISLLKEFGRYRDGMIEQHGRQKPSW